MPIYMITTKDEPKKRLVKADSSAAAIRHCAVNLFSAKLCTKVEDAAELMAEGVKVETAGAEPVAPQQERKPEVEIPAFIRDGDQIVLGDGTDGDGTYPARINVKAKTIQIKRGPGNSAADWADLRPATEEELTAETERTAK